MDATRVETPLIIVFADLTHFTVNAARTPDVELAALMDGWYELADKRVTPAGGRIVKFIGDAMLAVFPVEAADAAVEALLAMRRDAASFFSARGWDSKLIVKMHAGTVVAGPFGAAADKRFDVIGTEVNVAATLVSRGFAMSPDVFRKLSAAARKAFKKHTPPQTYIPLADERPRGTS
jgi:class 3 adenylate cyclase